ncbi:YdbC family protein [Blautia sp. HCP3S3_G3]|uniref:YdbC family protein n=1 Tax=Blautia sp. HCP3S3_G3 TaxID=3438913 RepID=UPI003F8A3ED1
MAGKELKYEIINQIGVISTSASGWNTELNRISWNGAEPKYDLRSWSPDHSKMGKGITLSESELTALADLLAKEVEFLKED